MGLLMYFCKKLVGMGGFDKEQSDAEREQRRPQVEQRRATLTQVSNPIFLRRKKYHKKIKLLTYK
ncbi:MAG: hypothetical protein E7042_08080 [Lentisphaerae bacterium]|nr:hypothetical protein [Lentisphaerota bacterium]